MNQRLSAEKRKAARRKPGSLSAMNSFRREETETRYIRAESATTHREINQKLEP
jgi:hypothetical protein